MLHKNLQTLNSELSNEIFLTSVPSVNRKSVLLVGLAVFQGLARDLDFLCVAHFSVRDLNFEGRVGDVFAHTFDRDYVLAGLAGSEGHAQIATGHLLQEARFFQAGGRRDRGV